MMRQVVATASTPNGAFRLETLTVNDQAHFELFVNDGLQMATRFSAFGTQLADAALSGATGKHIELLIGGLGLGIALRQALQNSAVRAVYVVEIEPRIITWNRDHLNNAHLLDDPRVELVVGDFGTYVQGMPRNYHGIVLHIDKGPDRVLRAENRRNYSLNMLQVLHTRLRTGGALAIAASQLAPSYERALKTHFTEVHVLPIDQADGQSHVIYQARA